MMKVLLILAIGVTAGYFAGFKDAQANEQTVVERLVNRAGGSHRENVKTDVDRQMTTLER